MQVAFTKMHGLGNDFVVVDATREAFAPAPALLAHLSDRHFGVGCDQVLVIDPPPDADVNFGYRIYNADGSESGQCLNGARCVARFVLEHGLSDRARLRLRTRTTTLELELLAGGRVRVDAGAPRFEPAEIPLAAAARARTYTLELADDTRLSFGAASMGNPHAVIEVLDIDAAPVGALGPALQAHPAFPEGVNVGFLQILDSGRARLRVFERGAGETLACGSGACAAFAVAREWGRLDARVQMQLRGGALELEWNGGASSLWMTGAAETVYQGSLEWPM